ncbi:hypothetical protein JCM19296_2869 [Nonlabens ulvanivorans]|uniref:Polysaccharide biosynthesis protein n=1 Tax=Nonlabens ulvanivorans TaxID=906888 RepID=A0A081DEB8_NONUL|nr:hypothetical protein JCM19296_2869 [Nonlabens ulvanivorans]
MALKLKTILVSNLFKNISWNAFGLIVSRLAILAFTLITVKLLSKEDFSELTYYRNILNLSLVIAGSSLSVAAIYFSSKTDVKSELIKIHTSLFFLSFILSLVSLIVLFNIPYLLSFIDSEIVEISSFSVKLLFLPLIFCVFYTISVGFFFRSRKVQKYREKCFHCWNSFNTHSNLLS